jgi:hypothetical protein
LLPSGDPNTGLLITEILYNPAGDEPDWEWIEIFNNTGSNIDFAATNYIVDDSNSSAAGTNITSGTLDNGEVGILFNVDLIDPNDFAATWGTGLNLIPVTNWEALQLNNDGNGDEIAIWDDPNAYLGDHQTHANAIVNQQYGVGDFPAAGQGQTIYLAELGLDPNDGNNWVLALESDDLSFFAMGSDPNGTIVFHDGGDEGSPGTFTSFTMEDADFNSDGFVNGLDFLKWQRGETPGDGSQAELALWEAQYGTAVTLSAVSSAVPEPRTLLLMLAGLTGMVTRRRL